MTGFVPNTVLAETMTEIDSVPLYLKRHVDKYSTFEMGGLRNSCIVDQLLLRSRGNAVNNKTDLICARTANIFPQSSFPFSRDSKKSVSFQSLSCHL